MAKTTEKKVPRLQWMDPQSIRAHPDGVRAHSTDSERARAARLEDRVVEELEASGPMTADECAEALGETPGAVRPRFSQLRARGSVRPTGRRRRNVSGKSAAEWELVEGRVQGELALS